MSQCKACHDSGYEPVFELHVWRGGKKQVHRIGSELYAELESKPDRLALNESIVKAVRYCQQCDKGKSLRDAVAVAAHEPEPEPKAKAKREKRATTAGEPKQRVLAADWKQAAGGER